MSAPKKLRAGTESEVTKLKKLWRDTLTEESRDYWRELFISPACSQAEIRKQLFARLKTDLRHDSQLTKFRDWELEQRALDVEAERQAEDERRALAENPNWTLDEARESVLKKAYQRAGARGDFKLGLDTVKQDLNAKKVTLDREKLDLIKTKAAQLDQIKALRDPKAALNDADRKAIVDKVDEIMGLK